MNRRITVVYAASAFIVGIVLLAGYFFVNKPKGVASERAEQGKKVIIFKDVKYSGEKKGVIDWEIRAKLMRKYIDTTMVEMEGIRGEYKPKPDMVVTFTGERGEMDTAKEVGSVRQVEIFYKGEYVIKSPTMAFDFQKSLAYTNSPVEVRGKTFTMVGKGLNADTAEQVITLEKDVSGTIQEEKGKYKFAADKFVYLLKDGTYIFEGNVVVRGERMDMFCDKVRVLSNRDAMEKIEAESQVRIVTKGTIAKSQRAVYYFKEDRVVLTEEPEIVRDNLAMKGEVITYNLTTDKFSVDQPKMRIEQRPKATGTKG
jgi:LPS export ABC transporter protein LptC/lipopolysaccharide transport protein LptA